MASIVIPAPVGGLNCRDGLSSLQPNEAIRLGNFIPRPGFVETRKGTGVISGSSAPSGIHTIIEHQNGNVLVGVYDGKLYEISDLTTSLATGFSTSLAWNPVRFQDRIIVLNGVNTPQVYNGTTVTAMVATGPTVATLWAGTTFKGRTYYWSQNEKRFWYAAAGAFQGTLTSFPLDTVSRGSGTLIAMAVMTQDGGNGPDDYAVFLMSDGEALVYQGDDPGSANSWQLVGVFRIGRPLGPQCWVTNGAYTIAVTENGPVDLAMVLKTGPQDSATVFNQNIGTGPYGNLASVAQCQTAIDVKERLLIVLFFETFIGSEACMKLGMDTESKRWFYFDGCDEYSNGSTGKSTRCIGLVDGGVYFGDSQGDIHTWNDWSGLDTIGEGGNTRNIVFDMVTAYSDLGDPISKKIVTALSVISGNTGSGFYSSTSIQPPLGVTFEPLPDFSSIERSEQGNFAYNAKPREIAYTNVSAHGRTFAIGLNSSVLTSRFAVYGFRANVKLLGDR